MGHRVCGRRKAHDRAARSLGASRDGDHHEGKELSDAQAPVLGLLKVRSRHRGPIALKHNRAGGRRNDDRKGGQGLASPLSASEEIMRNTNRRDYGNDAPMEITERFRASSEGWRVQREAV